MRAVAHFHKSNIPRSLVWTLCLFYGVQKKTCKVLMGVTPLNVMDCLKGTDSNRFTVIHLDQCGVGVCMKITDEMVSCPVCGWMRDHTSLR